MNKKNILLYILLAFLVVVNGFFLYNYLGHPKGKDIRRGSNGPNEFIAKELHFSDKQMIKFEEINNRHHEEMQSLSGNTMQFRDELFNLVFNENATESDIDSVMNSIAELDMKREKLKFYFLRDIRNICNQEQKKQLKEILKEVFKRGGKGSRPPKERHGPPTHIH